MPRKKAAATKPMTFDDLFELREQTAKISEFLHAELTGALQSLWPLMAAKRVFGQHLSPRESVKGADEALGEIQQRFEQVRERPFGLMGEMTTEDLASAAAGMSLTPWQYDYVATSGDQSTVVLVTSPNKWSFSYKSDYTLPQISKALREKQDLWPGPTRSFIVNALAMDLMFQRNRGLVSILESVGFRVATEKLETTGDLPLVTIESNLSASLPPDELLVKAARFSGVPAFIELIDSSAIADYEDPFTRKLQALLA